MKRKIVFLILTLSIVTMVWIQLKLPQQPVYPECLDMAKQQLNIIDDDFSLTNWHDIASLDLSNCENSQFFLVQFFKKNKAINLKNKVGQTPLHSAVIFKNSKVMQFLVNNGSQIDARDIGLSTPLMLSEGYNNIKFLVDNKADVTAKDSLGFSVLMRIVQKSGVEPQSIEMLIQNGADIKEIDSFGNNVLWSFFEVSRQTSSELEAFNMLIRHGADGFRLGQKKETLLMRAASRIYNIDEMQKIIEMGVPINAQDSDGNTALFYLADTYGSVVIRNEAWDESVLKATDLLRKNGINFSIKNSYGLTAYQYAHQKGYTNMLNYIKSTKP